MPKTGHVAASRVIDAAKRAHSDERDDSRYTRLDDESIGTSDPAILTGLCDPRGDNYLLNVEGNSFNSLIGVVIALNAIVLGLEADWGDEDFVLCENIFAVTFLVEMFMRIHHWGCRGYFGHFANCFDCFLVVTTALDLWILPYIAGNVNVGWLTRLLRSVRLLRVLRIIRLFRMFRPLGIMLDAFLSALGRVSWTGLLTLILMYMCSILLTQTVGRAASAWGEHAQQIDTWFGSIGRSMRTLFIVITLAEWDQIAMTVSEQIHPLVVFILASIYIILTAFTMVSLITGIISEALIVAQLKDEQNRLQELEEEREYFRSQLRKLLNDVDSDGSDTLSPSEMKRVLGKNGTLLAKLKLLDISTNEEEVLTLLASLENENGEVAIDDIIDALTHLTGNAKASSLWNLRRFVHQAHQESEQSTKDLCDRTCSMEARLTRLEEKLDMLCQHCLK